MKFILILCLCISAAFAADFDALKKEIQEKVHALHKEMQALHKEVQEYEHNKTDEKKKKLTADLEKIKTDLKAAEKLVEDELAKKPTDHIEMVFLEKEDHGLKALEKHVKHLEEQLNKSTFDETYADFDALKKQIQEKVHALHKEMQALHKEVQEYEHNKTDEKKKKLTADLEKIKTDLKAAEKLVEDELAKKPTDHIEMVFLEKEDHGLKALEKHVKHLEESLNKSTFDDTYDSFDDEKKAILEKIHKLEKEHAQLHHDKYNEWSKKHDKTDSKVPEMIKEVEKFKETIKEIQTKIETALKAETDAGHKKFLETEQHRLKNLDHHLDSMLDHLKNGTGGDDDTYDAWDDLRKSVTEKVHAAETAFHAVMKKMSEYHHSHSASLKTEIESDLEKLKTQIKDTEKLVEDEIAKKPTEHMHMFFLEREDHALKALGRHVAQLEHQLNH